jgi:hypothetical protein
MACRGPIAPSASWSKKILCEVDPRLLDERGDPAIIPQVDGEPAVLVDYNVGRFAFRPLQTQPGKYLGLKTTLAVGRGRLEGVGLSSEKSELGLGPARHLASRVSHLLGCPRHEPGDDRQRGGADSHGNLDPFRPAHRSKNDEAEGGNGLDRSASLRVYPRHYIRGARAR